MKARKASPATRVLGNFPAARPKGKSFLRLYAAGATTRSRQALRRADQLCEAELKDNYELEVIDVYQPPELARGNQIVATPDAGQRIPPGRCAASSAICQTPSACSASWT